MTCFVTCNRETKSNQCLSYVRYCCISYHCIMHDSSMWSFFMHLLHVGPTQNRGSNPRTYKAYRAYTLYPLCFAKSSPRHQRFHQPDIPCTPWNLKRFLQLRPFALRTPALQPGHCPLAPSRLLLFAVPNAKQSWCRQNSMPMRVVWKSICLQAPLGPSKKSRLLDHL